MRTGTGSTSSPRQSRPCPRAAHCRVSLITACWSCSMRLCFANCSLHSTPLFWGIIGALSRCAMHEPELDFEEHAFTRIAVLLHWLVACAILAQVVLGWWMLELPKTPAGLR